MTPRRTSKRARAFWAKHALLQYSAAKEGGSQLYDKPESVLSDLLLDLRIYAARESIDIEHCLAVSKIEYDKNYDGEHG